MRQGRDPADFSRFDDPRDLPPAFRGAAIAIGNFDGVHLGHRAVISAARSLSDGKPVLALTFEPHPRALFAPGEPIFRLTEPDLQAERLAEAGADGRIVLPFTTTLASMSAEAFVETILCRRLSAGVVATGRDFRFGKGRGGDAALLAREGESRGFAAVAVPPVVLGGEIVSSTAIRRALEQGDAARANAMLGAPWRVRAPVRHGEKRGRELGYPTANLKLPDGCRLRHGIYAVRARVADGGTEPWRDAVASFGRRPTFDDGAPLLEVHLFDFSGDLYGRQLEVAFFGFLRGEERFGSIEALVAQMDEDSRQARALLAALAGPDGAAIASGP